ncbi:hypothetical protein [Spirosoma aerophilum]
MCSKNTIDRMATNVDREPFLTDRRIRVTKTRLTEPSVGWIGLTIGKITVTSDCRMGGMEFNVNL